MVLGGIIPGTQGGVTAWSVALSGVLFVGFLIVLAWRVMFLIVEAEAPLWQVILLSIVSFSSNVGPAF